MWWHFVDEFYKPTQLARQNIHNYSDRSYDMNPVHVNAFDSSSDYAGEPYGIFEDNLDFIRAGAREAMELAAARDVGLRAPAICEDNLSQFFTRLSQEGKSAFGVWSIDSGFHMFSPNFEDITGIPSSVMNGQQWIMTLDSAHQYQAHRMLEIACEEQLPSQLLVQTAAVSCYPSKYLIMDIKPSQEDDRRVMVLFYDVTVQKQLEEALTKAEVSLKKANRGRSAFLSCMSHELRTPLNAIMGFSEMMRDGVLGEIDHPKYAEYVEHIHDSGSELLTKISTLLDIASLDSGGMAPSPRPSSLLEMLEELRSMHTHAAFASKLTIAMDVSDDVTLHVDPRMVIGALSHIMSNCIKYARKDSTIHISARRQKEDGIVIAVRDRGEGIAPERLSLIREALNAEATYFQMDGEGIGLGLSMAKELAARHGGRISIDSMPKQGTIVCVHIPQECLRDGVPMLEVAGQSLPNRH